MKSFQKNFFNDIIYSEGWRWKENGINSYKLKDKKLFPGGEVGGGEGGFNHK